MRPHLQHPLIEAFRRGFELGLYIIAAGLIGACASLGTTGLTPAQTALETNCVAYNTALSTLDKAYVAGFLPAADVKIVNDARQIVEPVCGPFLLSNDPSLLLNGSPQSMVTQALLSITTIEKLAVTAAPKITNTTGGAK